MTVKCHKTGPLSIDHCLMDDNISILFFQMYWSFKYKCQTDAQVDIFTQQHNPATVIYFKQITTMYTIFEQYFLLLKN